MVEPHCLLFRHTYRRYLSTVITANNRVHDSQSVKIPDNRFYSLLVDVVGEQDTGILHKGGNVGRFTSWRCTHVEDPLVLLGLQRHHRQETRGTLDDVMTRQILWRRAHRNLGRINNQSDLRPFTDRVEIYASVYQCLE